MAAIDDIYAASSTVDLTKQDTLEVTVTTATIAPTDMASQEWILSREWLKEEDPDPPEDEFSRFDEI